jgi:DnaK suppressor protein
MATKKNKAAGPAAIGVSPRAAQGKPAASAKAGAPPKAAKPAGLHTVKGIKVVGKPWGKKELTYFEKRLLEERKRAMKQLQQWDDSMRSTIQNADGDLSAYSFHMADQGTDAMEREKAFLFASKEGRYLWHVNQALRRLYKTPELFGICEMTGERIEYDRLDALPHARLSYKAKREEEGDADLE